MIEVREVKTKKEIKDFIDFPLNLYRGNPYFVPPLYGDEKKLFSDGNVYSDQSESVFYLAYQDGKTVGRIQGILQRAANQKWNTKQVRFTRFDSIDDQEVANALFSKLENWAKSKGMEETVGPLGYSDLEREGLLIDGFEWVSTFEEQYNYDYYQKLIENFGYEKDVDWVERRLKAPKELDERIPKISEMMMKKYELHFGEAKNTNDFLKKYADKIFDLLDVTYDNLYGTVPFTPAMKEMMIANFKLIIDIKYVYIILDKNERAVCFGLAFPSIGEALIKSGGKLTLPAIFKLLKALKKPKSIDLGLIGVLPEYAMRGISTAIIWKLMQSLSEGEIEYAETNLNLADNLAIQNQWKKFDSILHKRRRSYKKKIV